MKPFHIEIATPDGLCYDGEIDSLLIRTDDGDVEILAGHTDFLTTLSTGRARIIKNGESRFASASGGFISVSRYGVKVAAITFEFADEIDLKRAEIAKENAELALHSARDERDERIAKAKLARALNRINIAELK